MSSGNFNHYLYLFSTRDHLLPFHIIKAEAMTIPKLKTWKMNCLLSIRLASFTISVISLNISILNFYINIKRLIDCCKQIYLGERIFKNVFLTFDSRQFHEILVEYHSRPCTAVVITPNKLVDFQNFWHMIFLAKKIFFSLFLLKE